MKLNKKTLAVSVATLVIIGGTSAFAYWTSTGSGSGEGVASDGVTDTITLATPADALDGLKPGGSKIADVKATNTGADPATVETIGLDTPAITIGDPHAGNGCDAAWFTATTTNPASPVAIAAGATEATGSVEVTMIDSATENQDACKGATITVNLVTP